MPATQLGTSSASAILGFFHGIIVFKNGFLQGIFFKVNPCNTRCSHCRIWEMVVCPPYKNITKSLHDDLSTRWWRQFRNLFTPDCLLHVYMVLFTGCRMFLTCQHTDGDKLVLESCILPACMVLLISWSCPWPVDNTLTMISWELCWLPFSMLTLPGLAGNCPWHDIIFSQRQKVYKYLFTCMVLLIMGNLGDLYDSILIRA